MPETTNKTTEEELQEYVKESIEKNTSSINPYLVKRKYPKAFESITKYTEEKTMQNNNEELVMAVLLYNPLCLFEFFDSKNIFISIAGSDNTWEYTITNHIMAPEAYYDNRAGATAEGFLAAFEILEGILSSAPSVAASPAA